jgi:hypothetical protein
VFALGLLYDYHVMLNLGFVKVTCGNVKKAEFRLCLLFALFYHKKWLNFGGRGQTYQTDYFQWCFSFASLYAKGLIQ